MKSFEPVFKKLTELFIENLPEYVQKINEQYNDGIILKPFENKDLITPCNKLPSFNFSIEEAEYTEKDRIIENTIYSIGLIVNLPTYGENTILLFMRYVESINKMIDELKPEIFYSLYITKVTKNKIFFRIII